MRDLRSVRNASLPLDQGLAETSPIARVEEVRHQAYMASYFLTSAQIISFVLFITCSLYNFRLPAQRSIQHLPTL
jgi:hypothetical protein